MGLGHANQAVGRPSAHAKACNTPVCGPVRCLAHKGEPCWRHGATGVGCNTGPGFGTRPALWLLCVRRDYRRRRAGHHYRGRCSRRDEAETHCGAVMIHLIIQRHFMCRFDPGCKKARLALRDLPADAAGCKRPNPLPMCPLRYLGRPRLPEVPCYSPRPTLHAVCHCV